jgi:hypothetical protein
VTKDIPSRFGSFRMQIFSAIVFAVMAFNTNDGPGRPFNIACLCFLSLCYLLSATATKFTLSVNWKRAIRALRLGYCVSLMAWGVSEFFGGKNVKGAIIAGLGGAGFVFLIGSWIRGAE